MRKLRKNCRKKESSSLETYKNFYIRKFPILRIFFGFQGKPYSFQPLKVSPTRLLGILALLASFCCAGRWYNVVWRCRDKRHLMWLLMCHSTRKNIFIFFRSILIFFFTFRVFLIFFKIPLMDPKKTPLTNFGLKSYVKCIFFFLLLQKQLEEHREYTIHPNTPKSTRNWLQF